MKNSLNIKNIFQDMRKAKKYVQLQNEGISKMEAAYIVWGSKIGDELVKLCQHELIFETPIYN